MKTAPDLVAYTCARCGEVAAIPASDPGPAAGTCRSARPAPGRQPFAASAGAQASRRSPNCLYLGDPVLVRADGAPPHTGTIVGFRGPLVEISMIFRPSAHVGSPITRRVPWDSVRAVPPSRLDA